MKLSFIIWAFLLVICEVSASAEPYLDGNLGVNTTASSMGYSGDIGYLFNRYFAVEGGMTFSGSSNVTNSNYFMFDAAAKGILPLGSGIDIYGKLGAAACNSCGSGNSDLGLLYGAGLQFHINRNWLLHIEDYTTTGNSPNFIMFGGEFRFD